MAQEWYYTDGGRTVGPLTTQQLKAAAADGTIRPTDLVWAGGTTNRVPAGKVKGLRFGPLPADTPAAPPPVPARRAKPVPQAAASPQDDPTPAAASPLGPVAEQWWLVGLCLLCCFPAGLILVWLHPRMSKTTKWAVTGAVGVVALALMAASANRDRQTGQPDQPMAAQPDKGGGGGVYSKDYKLPHEDFVAYIDGCMKSDTFVAPPADATAVPDELLTEEFLPYSSGAEGWWEKRVTLDGKTGILLFDRNEVGGGEYADVLTATGVLKDGQRKITRTGLKEQTARHRRRVRDGLVEVGVVTQSGSVVQWEPWVKVGAKVGDSWSCRDADGREAGTAELRAVFVSDGRPCAVVRVSRATTAGGKPLRTQETGWLLKGVGLVRTELQNDLTGRFQVVSRSMLSHRQNVK
jgi:hypothetical protein